MTRQTRPERESWAFAVAQEKQRAVTALEIIVLVTAVMSGATAAVVYALADETRLAIGGAGIGAIAGVLYSTALGWDLVRQALATKPEPDDDWRFSQTGRSQLRERPAGVSELALWRYLIDIASGAVTLSQRGAAAHGFSQATANAIKDWVIGLGWYHIVTPGNNEGEWTEDGERVLSMLRRVPPASWNEIVREIDDGHNDLG